MNDTSDKCIPQPGGLRTRGILKKSLPEMPLITIITAVKNGAAHLAQTIESVLGQSWPNIEYIIFDACSTDGTLDIIRRYEDRIGYWVSEPDRGSPDAFNKGIALATGDLIGILNADDWYTPDAIETVATAFRENKLHGIYYGDKYYVQVDIGVVREIPASLKIWRGMTVCHQAMFIHREVYKNLGGYDLNYPAANDFDFLVRAIRAEVPFMRLDRPVVYFRNDGSSSITPMRGYREVFAVLKRNYGAAGEIYLKSLFFASYCLAKAQVDRLICRLLGKHLHYYARMLYYRIFTGRGKSAKNS